MEADPLEIARELIDEHEHAQSRHREGFNPLAPDPRAADVAQALIAKHAEVADANAEIDRLNAPVCSNCLLSEDIAGVSINTDCGQEYETICAKCQADPNVTDYVVHENAYEAFIATRRELEEKHAEVGRLREALTHLDRILAFSPVSHQTREFVRAALAQEAGK